MLKKKIFLKVISFYTLVSRKLWFVTEYKECRISGGAELLRSTRDPNILKSITLCVFRYIIDILVQVVCKHFKDEIGNDPIVFLDSNRKETTHC